MGSDLTEIGELDLQFKSYHVNLVEASEVTFRKPGVILSEVTVFDFFSHAPTSNSPHFGHGLLPEQFKIVVEFNPGVRHLVTDPSPSYDSISSCSMVLWNARSLSTFLFPS